MKNISMKVLFCAPLLLVAGCAGMPDMKGMPVGSTIANLVPGGGKFAGAADTAFNATKQISEPDKDISEPEEIEMGESLMSGVLGAAPLYDNERIQRYVNQVGRWVAAHSERPNLPWRFAVLNSQLPNAGAAPGGQIYITTGLLFRMRNEAELAGALAHEIAHVVQRHHVKAIQKQKKADGWASLGGAVVGGVIDAKAKSGLVAGAGKLAANFTIAQFRTIILLKLDRGEEEQADRMGMVLAARAGYDPFGLVNVLQLLQDLQKDQGGASLLYETHPSAGDRIASLDSLMSKEMEKYAGQATLQDRFIKAMLGDVPAAAAKPQAAPAKASAPTKAQPKKP
jgi:predicted Zn-dependent protease